MQRLLVFAILSEIPFNLAMGSRILYPIHQNVLWSFLISIGLIHWNENAKASEKIWKRVIVAVITVVLGYLAGLLTMVDFYHAGILTVLVFYFTKNLGWLKYFLQAVLLWYINMELLGGYGYEVEILGKIHFITRQGYALLALIPIWLYAGEQGPYNKVIKNIYYWFYPVHLLILGALKLI